MIKIHRGSIKKIKGKIHEKKNNLFKAYCNNSSNINLENRLRNSQVHFNSSTKCAKEKCFNKIASKLNDTQKNTKAYWSLIKIFLTNKKIPVIPPLHYDNLFIIDFRFIIDFKEKAEPFNLFFSFLPHFE